MLPKERESARRIIRAIGDDVVDFLLNELSPKDGAPSAYGIYTVDQLKEIIADYKKTK